MLHTKYAEILSDLGLNIELPEEDLHRLALEHIKPMMSQILISLKAKLDLLAARTEAANMGSPAAAYEELRLTFLQTDPDIDNLPKMLNAGTVAFEQYYAEKVMFPLQNELDAATAKAASIVKVVWETQVVTEASRQMTKFFVTFARATAPEQPK